jgi:hypothetical protein
VKDLIKEHFRCILVGILAPDHQSEDAWKRDVTPLREEIKRASRLSTDWLRECTRGSRCIGEILQDVYTVEPGMEGKVDISPTPTCSGCQKCGPASPGFPVVPDGGVISLLESTISDSLRDLLPPKGQKMYLSYDPPLQNRDAIRRWRKGMLRELLPVLVASGVREICVSDEWAELDKEGKPLFPDYFTLYLRTNSEMVIHSSLRRSQMKLERINLARVVLLEPSIKAMPSEIQLSRVSRDIIVVPSTIQDPDTGKCFLDRVAHKLKVNDFVGKLQG